MMEKKNIINNLELLLNCKNNLQKEGRQILLKLLEIGIQAANPKKAVYKALKYDNNTITLSNGWQKKLEAYAKIIIIGAGKASGLMAEAIEEIFNDKDIQGIINVPEAAINQIKLAKIGLHEAGHPYVTQGTINSTKHIIQLVSRLHQNDTILCLLSGGGSALLELPYEWIPLKDLMKMFTVLSSKAVTIHELNIIRRHLSQIKGGKLAKRAFPASVISLIISDVVGDNLNTIASGPTAPDESTWLDAKKILEKYHLTKDLPKSILDTIERGSKGEIEETLKPNNPIFKNTINLIIASNATSCKAMVDEIKKLGLKATFLSCTIVGEARDIGQEFAYRLLDEPENTVLIAGGETTVTITGKGKGGRNQEIVIAASKIIAGKEGCVIAAIDSDGKDGPTDAAGGIVDYLSIKKGLQKHLMIENYLEQNDSYNYLKHVNGLIKTGLTGTNVGDLLIGIKLAKERVK